MNSIFFILVIPIWWIVNVNVLVIHYIDLLESCILFPGAFSGLKAFYGKKAKLKNEISKRQHENYIQSEERQQVGGFLHVHSVLCSPLSHNILTLLGSSFNSQSLVGLPGDLRLMILVNAL